MGLQKRQRVNLPYQGGHMGLGSHPDSPCINVADVSLRMPYFKISHRNYKVEERRQRAAQQTTYCCAKLFSNDKFGPTKEGVSADSFAIVICEMKARAHN